MVRVVVVGSANVDLTVRVPNLPRPGETVAGDDVTRAIGGKGANQAVAAARLGAHAALVGAVGDDADGAELHRGLAAAGLDLSHLRVLPGVPTGVALIQVRPDGENMITLSPGANGRVTPEAVEAATGLLAGAGAVLLQLEVPLPVVAAAARAGGGAVVVLNAAPLPAAPAVLADLLPLVDVLVVNQLEALGIAAALGREVAGPPEVHDWPAVAQRLRGTGPGMVVVTLGPDGAALATADGEHAVPSYSVEVVDAVGAGDAFCAQLAVGLASGLPPLDAVRRACAAGALATTGAGAQGAALDADRVGALVIGVAAG